MESQKAKYFMWGGINIDASKIDHSKKSGNKVLFVGRDFERKNGPLVIEAFKLARKSRPDLELYIAGPKKKAPMEDGIVFLGDVSSENLPDIFNICDVFCMPSKLEAYGLVFVEALSFGLPCIGKNAYEMPYFIENGKTGYLLESDSAETLSRLLIDAINNEEMKRNVVDRQEFYIKEYSWKTVCERIYNAIELTK